MTWQSVGENRWHIPEDPDRHLLLHGSGHMAELHGQWRHMYTAAEQVDPAAPLDGSWPVGTVELTEPITSDEQGWQVLADALTQTGG